MCPVRDGRVHLLDFHLRVNAIRAALIQSLVGSSGEGIGDSSAFMLEDID